MKRLVVMVLVVLMSLSACLCAQAAELKWGSVHPETQAVTQMMMRAIEEINANAEDVHITGYPNGVLGGSSDLVEGVQEGFVEIITEGPAQFSAWIPKAAQVEAPYLWQSVEHMHKATNGGYKDTLNELFESINVRILGTFYYGTRQLTANKPINTLADLEGMKIRVPQSDLYVKMIESWGASATPMNINELYMALQTGTVDGQENPLTTYYSYKFYEVVKYVILTDHIICPNMIFINGDVWNSMSEHDQQVVQAAVDSAIQWQDEQILASEETLAEELKEYGVEIITPDNTIREATIPYIQPLIEDWDYIQSMA
ncbi:MAG: TRAP transporter substrate-binding protein DctP [Clostridia bacterium]|nr:TRAP transporter substrate-binding protein DctP [Clostridia bacterium]